MRCAAVSLVHASTPAFPDAFNPEGKKCRTCTATYFNEGFCLPSPVLQCCSLKRRTETSRQVPARIVDMMWRFPPTRRLNVDVDFCFLFYVPSPQHWMNCQGFQHSVATDRCLVIYVTSSTLKSWDGLRMLTPIWFKSSNSQVRHFFLPGGSCFVHLLYEGRSTRHATEA